MTGRQLCPQRRQAAAGLFTSAITQSGGGPLWVCGSVWRGATGGTHVASLSQKVQVAQRQLSDAELTRPGFAPVAAMFDFKRKTCQSKKGGQILEIHKD